MRELLKFEEQAFSEDIAPDFPKMTGPAFAMLQRQGFRFLIIEQDKVVAATVFSTPKMSSVALLHTAWVTPELRGKTDLLPQLIRGVAKISGRKMVIADMVPELIENKKEEFALELEPRTDKIYTYKGVFVYAPDESLYSTD